MVHAHLPHYDVLSGSVGHNIAPLVWMHLVVAIALVGCEFNAEWEQMAAVSR